MIVQLHWECPICSGFAIDSKLYLHARWNVGTYEYQYILQYDIVDSNEGLSLHHNTPYDLNTFNSRLNNFRMKDHIFFQAHAAFPNRSANKMCDIGYRKENYNCVDIDECKIMRHYCNNRKTL